MNSSSPLDPQTRQRISELEAKLQDTVDLLHLWKAEAFSYRTLIQAMVDGQISLDKAKCILAIADPTKTEELAG